MSRALFIAHDDARCRMVLEFYAGAVFVHLRVRRWAPSVLRLMRSRWPEIRAFLRSLGFARIHAFYRASNQTMPAFSSRFGFRELRRNAEWVLMECANA